MTIRVSASALLSAAALASAACTAETDREREIRAPAAEIAGDPVSCIQTSRISNTIVHDDYTIDFDMLGDELYRNTLPGKCPQLGFEERFAYSAPTGQLCSSDTITVLLANGDRGVTCSLGRFVPIRYPARAD